MFKNMGLGAKIGTGFALLILIAMGLGGLAVYNMRYVSQESTILAHEYMPEIEVASEMLENTWLLQYAMRGYSMTEQDSYLASAQESETALKECIDKAFALADKASSLKQLRPDTEQFKGYLDTYARSIPMTEATMTAMASARSQMNTNAGAFIENAVEYLGSQEETIKREIAEGATPEALLERLDKIVLANEVLDEGNALQIGIWRAQAQRDMSGIEELMKAQGRIKEHIETIRKTTRQDANLRQLDAIQSTADAYCGAIVTLASNLQDLASQNQGRVDSGRDARAEVTKIASAAIDGTMEIANGAVSALNTSNTIMIIGLIVALVVGIVLAIFITRSITGPVNRVIEGLTSGAEQVTSAASQVAGSSTSLAEGASEQASSLEETSASLEEMASMTRQTADNARQANEMASQAGTAAQKGITTMERMSDAIGRIKASSDETAKIIKTIDEIAFQTNLLALNAAVEAARAGDAGKGFAVVAEEVRNLAQRSAEAARNTSQLIQESQENADNGVKVSQDVGVVLQEIAGAASKVTQLVGEVSAATNEQTTGIEQVNNAVSQMDQVTQANAANSEEAASASEELSAQAGELNTMVDTLKAIVGGAGKAAASNGHHAVAPRPARQASRPVAHAPMKALQHKAAKSVPAVHTGKQVVNPSQVIPLDDEDLEDF